tara:strand:+ start:1979 stop:2728 length:750 start_codon:yes stop_codon:yes gene_type:complete
MFKRKKIVKNLKQVKDDAFILYHHLGLGDHIICNGLTNYLSKTYKKIYMPVFERNYNNVQYLYSQNEVIELFKIPDENEFTSIESFSNDNDLQILKVGFEEIGNQSFNLAFYKQLMIDYSISFDYFFLPKNTQNELKLTDHLMSYYNISNPKNFSLIHATSSRATHPLRRVEKKDEIFVEKDSDIFKNIFLYKDLISKAKELHCMNSSFIHIVERVPSIGKLFYHEIREPSSLKLYKEWKFEHYDKPIT